MTISAYSTKYTRELDAVQLLSLLGHNIEQDPTLQNIDENKRGFIRVDVKCPACGVSGAHIVSGSFSKRNSKNIRQPHFRFIFPDGADGHDKFCEHSEHKQYVSVTDQTVDFSKSNSNFTRYIGSHVCKSIEHNLFSQADIRNMRQWHFDKKKSAVVELKVNENQCEVYQFLRAQWNREIDLFRPEYGKLQNCNWRLYAYSRIIEHNRELIDKINYKSSRWRKSVDFKKALVKFDNMVFDIRMFINEYELVQKLCNFIESNDIGHSAVGNSIRNRYYFDAFSALLLFVNEWNLEAAISMYIEIVELPESKDPNLGNVIGLTPFVDFELFRTILEANEFTEYLDPNFGFTDLLNHEEKLMRSEFEDWLRRQ